MKTDPKTGLVIERIVDAPVARVWAAWTEPERLKGPAGERQSYAGRFLEVVPQERIVWTIALGPGWRPVPASSDVPQFTAVVTMTPHGAGTKYTAVAMHKDPAARDQHDAMGFRDGWGAALDQLVELLRG